MVDTCSLRICCKGNALQSLFEEISKVPFEIINGLLGFREALDQPLRIDFDHSAASTGQLIVLLEPSDALLSFVSTLRARNVDAGIIEHTDSPVGLDSLRMTEAGGAHNPTGGGQ